MTTRSKLRYRCVVALASALALLTAACGSDDEGSDASDTPATAAPAAPTTAADDAGSDTTVETVETEATDAAETTEGAGGADPAAEGVARAQAAVDAATLPPDKIGPSTPLSAVPEKKKVAWLECEQPSCASITHGFKDATAALGWELEVIPTTSFAQGPAVQQALDSGADYIATTGSPLATAETEIAAAKDAGVPYISCYAIDDPDFENNNLLAQCGDDTWVQDAGGLIINWAIADSQGAANILVVSIPDFPILVSSSDGAKAAIAENCPGCTLEELNVTIDQLIAGEVPAAVASAIQANQDIDYVSFTFGDLPAGVADTLEESGLLEGRKLIGGDFSAAIGLTEIIAGRHQAWTSNPKPYAAWLMVDAMARHSVGDDNPDERANAILPYFIVTDPAEAQTLVDLGDAGWPGPATMADQFKALWGI